MATTLTTSYQRLASIQTSTYSELRLYGKYNSQNTSNNTTSVTLQARIYGDGGSGSFSSGTVKINGDSTSLGNTSYSKGDEKTLKTYTYTVTHSSDGTLNNKSVSFSISTSASVGGSGTAYYNCPKINRYPTISTASNFTDEENPTMTWTTYSTYPLRAKMEVGTNYSFITRDLNKSASSCTFTLTDEERDRLINAAGDNQTLSVRFTICAMRTAGGTENDELSWSYLDRTMTVTPKGRIGKNGTWKRVRIYYGKSGTWRRCTPYYGKSGQWKRVK